MTPFQEMGVVDKVDTLKVEKLLFSLLMMYDKLPHKRS